MTIIITQEELEHLTETELRSKYQWILNELARQQMTAQECPLARISLQNIRSVLNRRRMQEPKM